MKKILARLLLIIIITSIYKNVNSHEFWIDPIKYHLKNDNQISAKLLIGENFIGSEFPYSKKEYQISNLYSGNKKIKLKGRLGDLPALNKIKGFNDFGTIEGALNIPSKWFLRERGLSFNNLNLFKKIYNYSKIDLNKNFIFFCYSGLESSINWFVSYELMKNKSSKLYEGSLFDWIEKNKLLNKK